MRQELAPPDSADYLPPTLYSLAADAPLDPDEPPLPWDPGNIDDDILAIMSVS